MKTVMSTGEACATWGRAAVRNKLDRKVWQQPFRGVVVTHNGTLNETERLESILAASRPGAALGGLTAARLDGLRGFEVPEVHLVLPDGSRAVERPGIIHHFSTVLGADAIHPTRSPRRTWLERSVIDAASWTTNPRHARAIVIATFQQRLTSETRMRETLSTRGACRNRGLIEQSILDAGGGLQSLPERDFREICKLTGLPMPTHQRIVRAPDGHHYLDAWFEELELAVEIHGIPHHDIAQWDDDLFRSNEIVIGGPALLFFSSYAVRHEQFRVAVQMARMAQSRGWDGPLPDEATFMKALGASKDVRLWTPSQPR